MAKKSCPRCGASLPEGVSFCPFCAGDIRSRREVAVPVRRWLRSLRRVLFLLALAALAAAVCLLYDAVTPDTYDAWGELTYHLNGSDYHLVVTFRNDSAPEPEYVVQTIEDWNYDRAAKLFVTHADTGADAGQVFRQQIETIQVQVVQCDLFVYSTHFKALGQAADGERTAAHTAAPPFCPAPRLCLSRGTARAHTTITVDNSFTA